MSLAEILPFHEQRVAPIQFSEPFGGWVVTRYNDVVKVLADHDTFSSDELTYSSQPVPHRDNPVMRSLVALDPPRHHTLRRTVSHVFTPRAMAAVEPRIAETAASLLARAGATVDVIHELAYPLSVHTIAGLLGVESARWPDFIRWTEAITSFFGIFTGQKEREAAFRQALAEMTAYFHEEFRRPRGIIATLHDANLTESELIDFCALLLMNGHETTKTLLVNSVLCLTSQPKPQAGELPGFIEEVLRYLPPTGGTDRFVTRPAVLDGQELQPGQRVVAMITAANRDPTVFSDPHRFDPARRPNPHVSFGHGIHFCLGAHLARLEARIALTALLQRGFRWELARLTTNRTPVGIDVVGLTVTMPVATN